MEQHGNELNDDDGEEEEDEDDTDGLQVEVLLRDDGIGNAKIEPPIDNL